MSRSPRVARRVAVALGVVATLVSVAACGGDKKVAAVSGSSPSPTPKHAAKAKPFRNPLTGLRGGKGNRLLVVKIDNTSPAHPQVGLEAADIGYIEQVEGGLTRLAAVFSSTLPSTVGPVRSARETDIDLFAQYGKVAYAFSGGQPAVVRELNSAKLFLEADGYGGGWFRELRSARAVQPLRPAAN